MSARALRRCLAAGAAGAAVLLAVPVAAGAHVEAEGQTTAGVTSVTFSFHHGCTDASGAEQPTTGLRVQLPESATAVEAADPAGWTSTTTGGELAWTGGSIAYDEEASFVVAMELTETEGSTVFFPTVQVCANSSESAWIDKSEDPEAEHAAPRIIAGAATTTGDHADEEESEGSHGTEPTGAAPTTTATAAGTSTTAPATSTDAAAPATESASSSSTPLIIGIIAAAVVLAIVAGVVLSRRGSSGPSSPSGPAAGGS